jgi:hypothetical protein
MNNLENTPLFSEIKQLIEQSKQQLATSVNSVITLLYWQIGQRINHDILNKQRAEYGKQHIATLAKQLQSEYDASFSEKNLRRMMQFAEVFSDENIVATIKLVAYQRTHPHQ